MNWQFNLLFITLFSLSIAQPLQVTETEQTLSACVLEQLISSGQFDSKNFEDKVLYLDFWASWCPPCAKSFPFLNALHHQYHSLGLEIIGINLDEKTADAEKFLSNHPAEFSIALDFNKMCAKELGVSAMPSSYLVDQDGVIRHIHLGFRLSQTGELRKQVEQLLSSSAVNSLD